MRRGRVRFKNQLKVPRLPFKSIFIAAIASLMIICFIVYLARTLRQLDFFKIKEVIIAKGNSADLSYLKGQNIFALDLKQESRYILQSYPTYKKIRLVRILPDRLFVDFVKRVPLAYIKLYR